jgi:hypothetical protein|tara:strand:- start:9955 stop:10263 length:309 start_codon:yes stop_codon:yes gene_type:complete
MTKKIKYSVGDIILCKSFAGPEVKLRVINKVNRLSGLKADNDSGVKLLGFEGCFVSRSDMMKLKDACVPYSKKDKPSACISFTYDWQIIRVVSKYNANNKSK